MSSLSVIKPLDYASLMNNSRERLRQEMAQTIEQLAGWLAVLEGGLTSVLDPQPSDIIEEERESTSVLDKTMETNFGQEASVIQP
jgi:hypothetical protein